MARIAISYRRSDSQDITGRIFDRLVMHYGKSTVFRDIDSIRPGIDFRTQIADALKATDVLLVVVGPHWLGRGEGAASRMDNEADPVRIEVETALKRDIPIIPVLVHDVKMPEVGELPGSLRDFAFRHAVSVDGGRDFDHHIEGLIRSLDQFFGGAARGPEDIVPPDARKPSVLKKYGLVGGLAAVVIVLAAVLFRTDMRQPAVAVQPQPSQPDCHDAASCAGARPASNGAAGGAIAGQPVSDHAKIRLREFFWGRRADNMPERRLDGIGSGAQCGLHGGARATGQGQTKSTLSR